MKKVKLYDVPKNTIINIAHLYIETFDEDIIEEVLFCHIDGAYSYCEYKGEPFHLGASTEVYIKN